MSIMASHTYSIVWNFRLEHVLSQCKDKRLRRVHNILDDSQAIEHQLSFRITILVNDFHLFDYRRLSRFACT